MQNVTESSVAALQEAAIDRLNWGGQFFDSILDTLTDEQLMARAGEVGNHAMWVMGHLAWTSDFILSMVTGGDRVLEERFDELFAGGTTPADDPAVYPSREELRGAIQQMRRHVIEWVRSLDEASAFAPVPEDLLPFAPNAITVPFTLVAHDLFHLGQVATVRSSLGLAPVHR